MENVWVRYASVIPEGMDKGAYRKNLSRLVRITFTYHVDIYLDALVAWDYYWHGYYGWAAVSLGIFSLFSLIQLWRSYRFATDHKVHLFRTPVIMLFWNVFFASDPPHVIDALTTNQLKAINEEGLLKAPLQLVFQVYVIIFQWARIGSPDSVQYASISISIISMAYASVRTFDIPYILLGLRGKARKSSLLVPYVGLRFFQLVPRVVVLALLPLVLQGGGVFEYGLVLCGMVAVRIWMFHNMLPSWEGTRKEGMFARLSPHYHDLWVRNVPPFTVILGSFFSDAFFGDAHFHARLSGAGREASTSVRSVSWSSTDRVSPEQEQRRVLPTPALLLEKRKEEKRRSVDAGSWELNGSGIRSAVVSPHSLKLDMRKQKKRQYKENELNSAAVSRVGNGEMRSAVAPLHMKLDEKQRKRQQRKEREMKNEEAIRIRRRVLMAKLPPLFSDVGFEECCGCLVPESARQCIATIHAKEQEQERARDEATRDGENLLFVGYAEVTQEIIKVTRGTMLMAVENCLFFLAALAKANQFDFDPNLIGRMALVVGGCMVVQGLLLWRVYYTPLNLIPRFARWPVTKMFCVHGMITVAIMCAATVTGIGSSKCPEDGCGSADSVCIPLAGTYECRCQNGHSFKKPGHTKLKDKCYDPCNDADGGGCGAAADCIWLTDSTYECRCEEGVSKKKPGATLTDICYDPCPAEGCGVGGQCVPLTDTAYECRCEEGVSIKKSNATLADICYDDPCLEGADCGFGGQCVPLTDTTYECRCDEERAGKQPGATLGDRCYAIPCVVDNGGCGNHHCWDWGRGGGASCTDMFCSPGELPSQTKISSSSSNLLQGLLENDDGFGASISWLGDMDGDGVDDVAVGATGDDDEADNGGAVYILLLDKDGSSIKEVAQKWGSTQGGLFETLGSIGFGSSVALIGDLGGDGVTVAVAVGASGGPDTDGVNTGAVFVLFLQKRDGSVKAEQKIDATRGGLMGPLRHEDKFGVAVAAIGDLDGDGRGEIAVGAMGDDFRGRDRGAVYVLFLHSDGMVRSEKKLTVKDVTQYFGCAVTGLGDLNGDGVPDVAVGAYGEASGGGRDRGAVYVLLLERTGTAKQVHKISATQGGLVGPLEDDDQFGYALAALGDLDGDGVVDLAVGAPGISGGAGGAYVLLLHEDGTVKSEAKITDGLINGLGSGDQMGRSMSAVRDVNGERGMVGLAMGSSLVGTGGGTQEVGAMYILRVPPGFVGMCRRREDTTGGGGDVCVNTPDFGYICEEEG